MIFNTVMPFFQIFIKFYVYRWSSASCPSWSSTTSPSCQYRNLARKLVTTVLPTAFSVYTITALTPLWSCIGLLGSAYSFGSILGNFIWSYVSDAYGRRVALLAGLFFTTLSVLCFGFAPTFTFAIIARFSWGLLNGNIGKSILLFARDDPLLAFYFAR